jgi:hypothetical protein
MSNFKTKLVCAWMLTVFGLSLTALPLYSDLFTKERYSEETSEASFSTSSSVSYTMMYVSPWTPFWGGLITLVGGFLVGRLQRAVADAKDA